MLNQQEYSSSLSVLCYVCSTLYQCSQILSLTIDNGLAVVTNDCYTRVSIGSKLPDSDVELRFMVTSLTECEEQCSRNGSSCNAFSFGVGVKGNGTCSISKLIPVIASLQTHPDYDVYVKRQQSSPWCDFNPLYGRLTTLNIGGPTNIGKSSNKGVTSTSSTLSNLISQTSLSLSTPSDALSLSRSKDGTANYGLFGIYDQSTVHHGRFPSGDDSRSKILDSFANRNGKIASGNPFGESRYMHVIQHKMKLSIKRTLI